MSEAIRNMSGDIILTCVRGTWEQVIDDAVIRGVDLLALDANLSIDQWRHAYSVQMNRRAIASAPATDTFPETTNEQQAALRLSLIDLQSDIRAILSRVSGLAQGVAAEDFGAIELQHQKQCTLGSCTVGYCLATSGEHLRRGIDELHVIDAHLRRKAESG